MFLELFSGSGGLSRALRARGFAVVSVDIMNGEHCDLLKPQVYSELKGWILNRMVWGVFAGTPCETFSRARRGKPGAGGFPAPLRSSECPRGLSGLSAADASKLAKGNMLADRAATLLRIADELALPTGEENPGSSILWLTSQRQRREAREAAKTIVVDHCAYGTSYRARTKFLFTNVRQIPEFAKDKCCGRGICSFTGHPHEHLSGAAAQRHGFKTAQLIHPNSAGSWRGSSLTATGTSPPPNVGRG